jgi:pilus assembly protein TadC
MELFAIFILIVLTIVMIGTGLFAPMQNYLHLRKEAVGEAKKRSFTFKSENLDKVFRPLGFLINPLNKRLTYLGKLKAQAEILRIEINISVLIGVKLLLALLLGLAGFIFLREQYPGYVILLPFVGFFVPDYMMWQKVKGKKEDIVRCFPETVDLLHMCINAGADLVSAIKWLVDKSTGNPFIEQLTVVLSEVQVGKPRAEALRDMAKRLQLSDISSFSRVIVQAERMGTPVEEAFRNLSEDTRDRRYQNGERYAIKASLKILFPLVFCILPAIMIIVAGPIIIRFSQGDMLTTF